jgi:hypothetical protein
MAADAARGRIRLMLKDGESLPQESNPKDVKLDNDTGFVNMICIDLSAMESDRIDYSPVEKVLTIPSLVESSSKT